MAQSPNLYLGGQGWIDDPRVANGPNPAVGPQGRGMFPGLLQAFAETPAAYDAENPFRLDHAVRQMMPAWATMNAVIQGTDYLRAQATQFLPTEPRERADAWFRRVERSCLAPYTARLIENAAGAVLRRPIQIDGIRYWSPFSENVDGIGSSINEFARRLLVSALTYGHSMVLVDYPMEGSRNLLEQRLNARRPFFNHIPAPSINGWRQAGDLPSSPVTQIRIRERGRQYVGSYGEQQVDRIRLLEPGRYRTITAQPHYASNTLILPSNVAPAQYKESPWEDFGIPIMPVVPMYTNRRGLLRSAPLLTDIAYLNIAHYQRMADLLHALHIAAMPTLILEGWDGNETTSGVNYALAMEPGNQAYYVKSDSGSFNAQSEALLLLEQQMSNLGVTKLLGQKFVAESADAKRIDQSQANSVLAIISMELESCIQECYNLAAAYTGNSAPKITLDRDFQYERLLGQDISVLGDLVDRNLLTVPTYLKILRSGEIIPDTVNLQQEITDVETLHAAALANVGASAPTAAA